MTRFRSLSDMVRRTTPFAPPAAVLEDGAMLLETAIADCRALFVDAMFLWATDESRPLYARHGFAPPSRVLVNELSRPSAPGR